MTTDRELMQQALFIISHLRREHTDDDAYTIEEALHARLDGIALSTGLHPRGKRVADDVSEDALETVEIEAPVEIEDKYVKDYLWEHHLVAIDEGDLRKLMPPRRLLAAPALMEQAGWVRKKEWQRLTDEEKDELISRWAGELVFEVEQALKEKNT